MAPIFSGTYSAGITLNDPANQNPATIAASGYVTNNSTLSQGGDALDGNAAASWEILNLGTIKATEGFASGVSLQAGGTVINATNALIGGIRGVYINGGAGTVI